MCVGNMLCLVLRDSLINCCLCQATIMWHSCFYSHFCLWSYFCFAYPLQPSVVKWKYGREPEFEGRWWKVIGKPGYRELSVVIDPQMEKWKGHTLLGHHQLVCQVVDWMEEGIAEHRS